VSPSTTHIVLANRRTKFPNLAHVLGVDKVTLTCQVRELPAPGDLWASTGPHRRSATVQCGAAPVQVTVGSIRRAFWARMEWNPSRMLDPEGWTLCPLDEWLASVEGVAQAVCRELEPVRPPRLWNLNRLDLARDFLTDHPERFLVGLHQVKRAYAKDMTLYRDPATSEAQALVVGVGRAGSVRLYDKHQERSDAPYGLLRWELQAKRWIKRIAGVRTVGDATEASLVDLARDRWEWSGMGATVVGAASAALVIDRLDLSELRKDRLLGRMVRMSTPGLHVSEAAMGDVHRVMAEFGIALGPQWERLGEEQPPSRLDLEQGIEVVEGA
jgi:hypothetical protein